MTTRAFSEAYWPDSHANTKPKNRSPGKWARRQPSYGPDWDAAIEFGIDVSLIEVNLSHSYEERFAHSLEMTRFIEELDAARERMHAAAK